MVEVKTTCNISRKQQTKANFKEKKSLIGQIKNSP